MLQRGADRADRPRGALATGLGAGEGDDATEAAAVAWIGCDSGTMEDGLAILVVLFRKTTLLET